MSVTEGLRAVPGESRSQREQRVMSERYRRLLSRGRVQHEELSQRHPIEICGGKKVCTPEAVTRITAPSLAGLTNPPRFS